MKAGYLLFTYKKEVFTNAYGKYAVDHLKKHNSYRGETPKTITFEMPESYSREKGLDILMYLLKQWAEKTTAEIKDRFRIETKYAGKTIINV